MRTLGIAAAILATTMDLTGCQNRKQEPIPGPRAPGATTEAPLSASPTAPGTPAPSTQPAPGARHHGASGISWFQGGLDEAFSCPKCTAMFWRQAIDR